MHGTVGDRVEPFCLFMYVCKLQKGSSLELGCRLYEYLLPAAEIWDIIRLTEVILMVGFPFSTAEASFESEDKKEPSASQPSFESGRCHI